MKNLCIFSTLLSFLFVSPTDAEFYRYTDQHGNRIHADDLNQVPQDQRSKAEVLTDTDQLPPFGPRTGKAPNMGTDPSARMENERRRLAARKAELEAEYRFLVKENERLKEEQKVAATPEQVKAINKKVVDFNARFGAYQEKKAVYDARREAFRKKRTAPNLID